MPSLILLTFWSLIVPFIAIVVSLVCYRLTAAYVNQAPPGYGYHRITRRRSPA